MEIHGVQEVLLQAQPLGSGSHETERQIRAFLHHFAQLAREFQVAFAGQHGGFDGEQVAAGGGPGQAVHHARKGLIVRLLLGDFFRSQEFRDACGGDDGVKNVSGLFLHFFGLQAVARQLAQHAHQLAFQLAHAGFAGVTLNEFFDGAVLEHDAHILHSIALERFWNQVSLGDGELLPRGVPGQINDLQAVIQRLWNVVPHVGGGDEKHLAQVVAKVQIMILKVGILFRIQDFQQRAAGVAAVVAAHLVKLIQQHEWIADAGLFHQRYDAPRHGADVGAAVAADLRLVAHATERKAHEGPVQGTGDAACQASLADPGRAHQTKDGTTHGQGFGRFFPCDGFRAPLPQFAHDGEMFKDAGLHFLQPRVILVQHDFGFVQIQALVGQLLPGQCQEPIYVGPADRGFGALGWHGLHAVEFFEGFFFGLVGHARGEDLFPQFLGFTLLVRLAQLLLDDPHFLVQHVLFVVLVQPRPGFFVHLALDLEPRRINLQQLLYRIQPGFDLQGFQDGLLLFDLRRDQRGHGVYGFAQGQFADLIHAEQPGCIWIAAQKDFHIAAEGFQQGCFTRYGRRFLEDGHFSLDGFSIGDEALQPDAGNAFHAHLEVVLGQRDQGFDQGKRADLKQILRFRFFDLGIFLGQ